MMMCFDFTCLPFAALILVNYLLSQTASPLTAAGALAVWFIKTFKPALKLHSHPQVHFQFRAIKSASTSIYHQEAYYKK